MNEKPKWKDVSNVNKTYIRHVVYSGSVILSVTYYKDNWFTYSNIFPEAIDLGNINLETAKQEAIQIAKQHAEEILNDICKITND
jgi:hypothetical protein